MSLGDWLVVAGIEVLFLGTGIGLLAFADSFFRWFERFLAAHPWLWGGGPGSDWTKSQQARLRYARVLGVVLVVSGITFLALIVLLGK